MDRNERVEGVRSQRRCAVTYEIKPEKELIRFVANDVGEIFPDVSARAPGRGVWVGADSETLEKAIKNNAFAKSLKRKANPSEKLVEQTRLMLEKKCLDALILAKRSGQIILGYDQVCDALEKAKPAFIIEASDGSQSGREKVFRASKRWNKLNVVGCFKREDLDNALSRDNSVHILFLEGKFAKNWQNDFNRLLGFMPAFDESWLDLDFIDHGSYKTGEVVFKT